MATKELFTPSALIPVEIICARHLLTAKYVQLYDIVYEYNRIKVYIRILLRSVQCSLLFYECYFIYLMSFAVLWDVFGGGKNYNVLSGHKNGVLEVNIHKQ